MLIEGREIVTLAAIRFPNGTVVTSDDHFSCILKAIEQGLLPDPGSKEKDVLRIYDENNVEDGFVTSWSRFVDRGEASQIAVDTGQIEPKQDFFPSLDASQIR